MAINFAETLSICGNAVILALLYTLIGLVISYVFYNIFDEYGEDWVNKSDTFKVVDVTVEIGIIAIVSFWSSYYIQKMPPIFPLRKDLGGLVNGYISGAFLLFGVFLFLDDLTDKVRHVHEKYLSNFITRMLPQYGSIIDLSLSYNPPRKTEAN